MSTRDHDPQSAARRDETIGRAADAPAARGEHGRSAATGAQCERCGNPINEHEGVWVRDATGRLRVSTLAHLELRQPERVGLWHTGCLHTAPYR